MGRVLTSYESWLTGEMVIKETMNERVFAEMTRQHFHVYVIEDNDGPRGVTTFMLPNFVNVILMDTFWIRPGLRGATVLMNRLITGAMRETGRKLMVAQVRTELLESKAADGWTVPLPQLYEQVYTHEGMCLYGDG
jgi:hypothetical protein